jgi:hypothetical protein
MFTVQKLTLGTNSLQRDMNCELHALKMQAHEKAIKALHEVPFS